MTWSDDPVDAWRRNERARAVTDEDPRDRAELVAWLERLERALATSLPLPRVSSLWDAPRRGALARAADRASIEALLRALGERRDAPPWARGALLGLFAESRLAGSLTVLADIAREPAGLARLALAGLEWHATHGDDAAMATLGAAYDVPDPAARMEIARRVMRVASERGVPPDLRALQHLAMDDVWAVRCCTRLVLVDAGREVPRARAARYALTLADRDGTIEIAAGATLADLDAHLRASLGVEAGDDLGDRHLHCGEDENGPRIASGAHDERARRPLWTLGLRPGDALLWRAGFAVVLMRVAEVVEE